MAAESRDDGWDEREALAMLLRTLRRKGET